MLPLPLKLPQWSSNRQQADGDDLNPFRASQNAAPGVEYLGASLSLQACQSRDGLSEMRKRLPQSRIK